MFTNTPFITTARPPAPTGDIEKKHIRDKLTELGVRLEDVTLGVFDELGEMTARKKRSTDNPLYKTAGSHFRPNYERGILIYSLIKHYKVKSFLEIGFGRGYGTFCAALAMAETEGATIHTVDPALDKDWLEPLTGILPKRWFEMIKFNKETSDAFFSRNPDETFDMIYIDGDHTYEGVLKDWQNASTAFNKVILFDDYHLPIVDDPGIQVAAVVDHHIEGFEKELIIMDRRIFYDDRKLSDDEIHYGQVVVTKPAGE